MSGLKLVIFLGSTRANRLCDRVHELVVNEVKSQGMIPITLDPMKLPFNVISMPLHFMDDPKQAPQWMLDAHQSILEADAYLVITPEYNAGVPPALSNMLDHFSPTSYRHRPVAIVTYSPSLWAGMRCSTVLRPLLSELGMVIIPAFVAISEVNKVISENGTTSQIAVKQNVEKTVSEMMWYARTFKDAKERESVPTLDAKTE